MQVGKWGNRLAVRLPDVVVEALGPTERKDIGIVGTRTFGVRHDSARDEAIEELKALNWTLPPCSRFGRDEANER